MTAVTQKTIWDVLEPMTEEKRQKVYNFAVKLSEPQVRTELDFNSYCVPTERGRHVKEYMKEMRDDDRL